VLIDIRPFEGEDFAAAPAAEVGEPACILEIIGEVGDDAFVLVVLEESLTRVALGKLADARQPAAAGCRQRCKISEPRRGRRPRGGSWSAQ